MTAAVLELVDVTKTYPGPPPVRVLDEVSLTVFGGEMVAIVGSSGSGKSTLLNVAGILDRATSGLARVTGSDVDALAERERDALRAATIGFVFQAFHLIPYQTCRHNVMLPLVHRGIPQRRRRELAAEALEVVGLGHRIDAFPTTLSGGEQQCVAIARAIVHDPVLLLCDEPTGNLDRANTEAVLTLMTDLLSPHRAVVVVTHEEQVRQAANRSVEIRDGSIVV